MATNQTRQYGLHLWEPGDHFLREEFNENFADLDAAARVVTGTYTGDGARERKIELGFTPLAVLVMREDGAMGGGYSYFGGLALPGHPVTYAKSSEVLAMAEGGFIVHSYQLSASYYVSGNDEEQPYHFVALR